MPTSLRSWWERVLRWRPAGSRCWQEGRPRLEYLEDRTLLNGHTLDTALVPKFNVLGNGSEVARQAGFLSDPQQVDVYQVHLDAGDQLSAGVAAQTAGSALQSVLRVFDQNGNQVALDDQEGGDPSLTFQAPGNLPPLGADYYVGVSSAGNDDYDPTLAGRSHAGSTTGLYTLDMRLQPGAALEPDLAANSFRLAGAGTAAYGDQVTGTYEVENRGGAPPGPFQVQLVLSPDNRFDPSTFVVLPDITVPPPSTVLQPGQSTGPESFTITLPAAAPSGFPASGPVYLGLEVVPVDSPRSNELDPLSLHRGSSWQTLTIVTPGTANSTNHTPADAQPLTDLNSRVSGTLATAGQVDWYQVSVSTSGRLTADVAPTGGLAPRLALYGSDESGNPVLLIQSDSGPIVQHLQPDTYFLAVSAQAGSGEYQLTSKFGPANPPFSTVQLPDGPKSVAVADLNGDGQPDLIVANSGNGIHLTGNTISVLLGNGDGSFQSQQVFTVGSEPSELAVADVNGDGKPDLVVANYLDNTVSVLLGNGDGSFQSQQTFDVGKYPRSVAVADLNGDGNPDLVVANYHANTVSVLLGNGKGSFQNPQTFDVGPYPTSVAVADVNGDGIPDLVVANYLGNTVSVLLGNGAGSFQKQHTFTVGASPYSVAVADLNGDGIPDLVVTNQNDNTIGVLLGKGNGTFQPQQTFATGPAPASVTVGDINGDGRLDLVVANLGASTASVLLGKGDGTFQPQQTIRTGSSPRAVVLADLNGDGRPDLVAADYGTMTVGVVLGNGDGSFQSARAFDVGASPQSVAVADVNGDGKPDLVVPNFNDDTVSVLLGDGNGFFDRQRTTTTGSTPGSGAVADLNGDGRPDLVVPNFRDNTVGVLLGNGDGTFQNQRPFPVGQNPTAVAVADVNGDGKPDLIVANRFGYTVSVLLGNGDGSFQLQRTFAVGHRVTSVAVADLNGDGKPDLIVANSADNTVSVLLGNGAGSFQPQRTFTVGASPYSVAVADLNGDDIPDLVVANYHANTVSVLLGNGKGSFQNPQTFGVGPYPSSVAVADVNGDGIPDLVVANQGDNTVSVLLGNGAGSFQPQRIFTVGATPYSVAVADLNGDGIPDLVVANKLDDTVSVLLGKGDGTFAPTTATNAVVPRNTPSWADFNGDGIPDTVLLNSAGAILFRKGLPGSDNQFAPPMILNDKTALGENRPARDLTAIRTASSWAIAAADAHPDPNPPLPGHPPVYSVSLYTYDPNTGTFTRKTAFTTQLLPTHITAADLTGDGLDDLVVANSLDNSVQVAFQQPDGTFSPLITLPVGVAPSDSALVDVNGDGRKDIVVSDQASGDVAVLLNLGNQSFAPALRFRAGAGLFGLDTTSSSPVVNSLEQSVSLTAGDFTGDGHNDLVVVNRGAHSFSVLRNDGHGGFLDAEPALTTSTSDGPQINDRPGPVVAGDFDRDGQLDLAILMEDTAQVWVYTGDGHGHFRHTFSIAAGSLPTGLSAARDPETSFLDLLVGNAFGDVLVLRGKGDGTFQPPPPFTGDRVTVAVQPDLLGSGRPGVLVSNQQASHVTLQGPTSDSSQFAPVQTLTPPDPATQRAPVGGQLFRLEAGTTFPDAVVMGSGSNDVLVYRATGPGQFSTTPLSIPVGDNPVAATIADLNGDGIPDMLVANQGSNDISVLFGQYDASGHWFATAGPRLKSGGSGPIATALEDLTGPDGKPDGIPDLVITNAGSGTETVLRGVGGGFFDDLSPLVIPLSGPPLPPVSSATGGLLVPTSNGIFSLASAAASLSPVFIAPAGQVIAAVGTNPTNGDLAVALQDGTVEMLHLDSTTGLYDFAGTLTPLNGVPLDPSSLAVLPTASGFEVLVTSAGQDTVFVFAPESVPGTTLEPETNPPVSESTPGEPAPSTPPGPPNSEGPVVISFPETPPATPVAQATPTPEAPLLLVVTLATPESPDSEAGPGTGPGEGESLGQDDRNADAALDASAGVGGSDDLALAQADDTTWAEDDVGPGADDGARHMDLYRKPQDRDLDAPVSLNDLQQVEDWLTRVLALLGQKDTEEQTTDTDLGPAPQPGSDLDILFSAQPWSAASSWSGTGGQESLVANVAREPLGLASPAPIRRSLQDVLQGVAGVLGAAQVPATEVREISPASPLADGLRVPELLSTGGTPPELASAAIPPATPDADGSSPVPAVAPAGTGSVPWEAALVLAGWSHAWLRDRAADPVQKRKRHLVGPPGETR